MKQPRFWVRRTTAPRRAVFAGALLLALAGCQASAPTSGSPATSEPATIADRIEASRLSWIDGDEPDLRSVSVPVAINFWATNCAPCVAEMPMLQTFAAAHPDEIAVVGIAMQPSTSAVESFLDEYGVTYPVAVDVDLAAGAQFPEVIGLPVTLLVGADGNLIDTHIGKLSENDLEEFLAA